MLGLVLCVVVLRMTLLFCRMCFVFYRLFLGFFGCMFKAFFGCLSSVVVLAWLCAYGFALFRMLRPLSPVVGNCSFFCLFWYVFRIALSVLCVVQRCFGFVRMCPFFCWVYLLYCRMCVLYFVCVWSFCIGFWSFHVCLLSFFA